MSDRVNQPKWNITGSRVYSNGEGKSFNLTNKITAEQLYNILTEYEKTINYTKNTTKINKQLTQIQMTLSILQHEISQIKELIKNE